ncbi:class I SAM-dependent methyltransferase [Cupriavidus sp. 2TAF22]|uniref:class I SAM-dependent methyltransferase n=1 Tax=unclassified Cupriavidus TaxID=2640874 RepID=UPI003F92D5E9
MNHLDAVATEYLPNSATELENDLVLNWYPGRIIERFGHCEALLELGLGHGFTASAFDQRCDRHVIVEGSPLVIELFGKRHPELAHTVVLDYFETFETEQRFDVIVMGFILEHVDDPGLLLARYRRFLKPGGKVYVAVPNAKSMNRRLGLELGLIDDIYSLNANDIALGHQRQYCRDTLRAVLNEHGYAITHEEGIYLKPLPLSVLKTLPDMRANMQAMLKVGVGFPDLCVALLVEAQLQ